MTTGEYLTNANCDDRLYPGALAQMAQALDDNPDRAVAYADVDQVLEIGGDPIGRFEWAEGGLDQLMKGCFLGPMPMWRRSLHDTHGLFDAEMRSAGDYEFWLRLAAAGETFHHIAEPLGAYLMREDSLESREKLRSLWEQSRAKSRHRRNGKETP
jgi:hypothetical protein